MVEFVAQYNGQVVAPSAIFSFNVKPKRNLRDMLKEKQIPFRSGSLNIGVGPDAGPPLLLLHGVLRQWSDVVPILPALTCRWRAHALDFRGHGRSSRVPGKYRVVDYVEDARKIVEMFDQPVVIYGHSLGAMVAAATAAAVPDKVRAVILEDPPFETMGRHQSETALQSLFAGFQACLEKGNDIVALTNRIARIELRAPRDDTSTQLGDLRDRAALRLAAAGLAKIDPDVLTPIVAGQWLQAYDIEAVMRGIQCPTLVLQADTAAGGMLTDTDATQLAESCADCSTIKFPGTGHLIHWSATTKLLSVVTAFLESLR